MQEDHSLDTLLILDGESMEQDRGHWVKFEVHRVDRTKTRPHGVRYSLTLHNRRNQRVMGFDNAHAAKEKKGQYKARRNEYDHHHQSETCKGIEYRYDTADQLLVDFWEAVAHYLASH